MVFHEANDTQDRTGGGLERAERGAAPGHAAQRRGETMRAFGKRRRQGVHP